MTVTDNVDKVSTALDKVIRQLTQIDGLAGGLTSKSGSVVSSLGSGNSIMTNSATFSGQTSSTQQNTTSNGMGIPRFGAAAAVGAMAAVGGAAWASTPGVQDAYARQSALFPTAFAAPGGYNGNRTSGKVFASFHGSYTSTTDPLAAAALLTGRGLGMANPSMGRVMGEAGFMSKMTGMNNAASASGIASLQTGVGGVSGKLAQYGLFTNDLRTGKYKGLGSIVDQLWGRWYGSPSKKVSAAAFEAGLMGGWVGQDLANLFGSDPALYQQIVTALRIKQKAGGAAGINFSNTAKGPKSGNALAQKFGLNSTNNPMLTTMSMNEGRADAIGAATPALMAGFEDAAKVINTANKAIEAFANTSVGNAAFRLKGFTETMVDATETAHALSLALGGAAALLPSLLSGLGGGAAGKGGKVGSTLGKVGRAGGGAALAFGGSEAVDFLHNTGVAQSGSALDRVGTVAASAGAGALSGAAIGSIFPGLGTAIGAVVGTIVGGAVGLSKQASYGEGAGGGSGDLSRGSAGAVGWAAGPSQNMKGKFPGLCDHYVANAYGLEHSGYADARTHWQATPDRYRHQGDTNPPVGSLVFWDTGKSGHVAIVTGYGAKGAMVSTTHKGGGTPTVMPLSDASRQLGGKYYGWTTPYFQGRTTATGAVGGSSQAASSASATPATTSGTPVLPEGLGLSASAMANPMSTNMLGSGSSIFGSPNYRQIDPLSNKTGEAGNTTSAGGSDLGGTTGATTNVKGSASERKVAAAILSGIGAPTSKSNVAAMLKWMAAEGGNWHNSAKYNPLNTTLSMPGSRSAGTSQKSIKAYSDWNSGITATVNTLTSGNHTAYGYDEIVNAFKSGGNQQAVYDAIVASKWGTKHNLPGYSQGAYNVTNDQTAQLHAGETVLPAYQGQQFRAALDEALSGTKRGGDVTINVSLTNASNDEAMRLVNIVKRELKKDSKNERMRTR